MVNANDLIIHAYIMNFPLKTPKDRDQRASELTHMWRSGESSRLRESREDPLPFPIPCPLHLLHLTVPELYLLTRNLESNKSNASLSSVSLSSHLIEPKEVGHWNL